MAPDPAASHSAASLLELLLGLQFGAAAADANNRFTLEGVTSANLPGGALEIRVAKASASSLRLAFGPLTLQVGELALQKLVLEIRAVEGSARLCGIHVELAEFTGLKVAGPLHLAQQALAEVQAAVAQAAAVAPPSPDVAGPTVTQAWSLAPLAAAEGTIQAQIVDAQLLFDANVTVPVHAGGIDFNRATVEHIGPDSRMGVSRLGLYVDAPNGRSYLYQFPAAAVAGVEYERRGALPGPWGTKRGSLQLQPFMEALLRQGAAGRGPGFTAQSRLLFDRTAVTGFVKLGDGKLAAPGAAAELFGSAAGSNVVRVHSKSVGRGLTVEVAPFAVRDAAFARGAVQADAGEITGALVVQLAAEAGRLDGEFVVQSAKLSRVQVRLGGRGDDAVVSAPTQSQ